LYALADDDSSDDMHGDSVFPVKENPDFLTYPSLSFVEIPSTRDSTFVGKMKNYCPQLYNSLSAMECDHLNSILFPDQTIREKKETNKSTNPESGDLVLGGDFSVNSVEAPYRTPSSIPNSLGIVNTVDSLPSYGQPVLNDFVLDHLISDLIPPIVQPTNPIPLPPYLGTLLVLSLDLQGISSIT